MALPSEWPIGVFTSVAAHLGDVSIGGARALDAAHLADLIVYPGSVVAVFKKWVLPRPEDGLVIVQTSGPLRVRTGRFPPWQNSVVWVRQDRQLAMLLIGPSRRRQLRALLTTSGFGMKEDRMSLSHGRAHYEP